MNPNHDPKTGEFSEGGGSGLSKDQEAAVKTYTGSEYEDINNHFREGDKVGPRLTEVIRHTDAAFAASSLAQDTVAYRVVGNNAFAAIKEAHAKGESFGDKAYVSTTTSTQARDDFGKLLNKNNTIELRVPKGHKAIDVSKFSEHPHEKELLLDRRSKFRVVSIKGNHAVVEVHT